MMAKLSFTKSGRAFRSPKDKQGVGAWDFAAQQRHLAALERKSIIPPAERPVPRRRRDGIDRKNMRGEV